MTGLKSFRISRKKRKRISDYVNGGGLPNELIVSGYDVEIGSGLGQVSTDGRVTELCRQMDGSEPVVVDGVNVGASFKQKGQHFQMGRSSRQMERSVSISVSWIDEDNPFRASETLFDEKLKDWEVAEFGRQVDGLIALAVSVGDVCPVFYQQLDDLQIAGVSCDV